PTTSTTRASSSSTTSGADQLTDRRPGEGRFAADSMAPKRLSWSLRKNPATYSADPNQWVRVFVIDTAAPSRSTTLMCVVFGASSATAAPVDAVPSAPAVPVQAAWSTVPATRAAFRTGSVSSSTGTSTKAGSPSTLPVDSSATSHARDTRSTNSTDPGS